MKNFIPGVGHIQLDNQKKLLIVILSVALLFIDISFVLKPQVKALERDNQQIAAIKADLDKFTRELAVTPKVPVLIRGAVAKKILSGSQVPGLLQDISELANKNGIKILQMRPERDIQPTKEKMPGIEKLTGITIMVELIGGYHQFGKFINSLENDEDYIAVQDMKISPQPEVYAKQKITLVLKTYVK